MNKKKIADALGTVLFVIFGVVLGFTFSHFVVQSVHVSGISMEPTYHDGDILLMKRKIGTLKYGDIVVLEGEYEGSEHFLIKRVIGCPGDTIEITVDGDVERNGKKVEEKYIAEKIAYENRGKYFSVELGEGEYYVMGDNRNNSWDSRMMGPIKKDNILGVVSEKEESD